MSVDDCLPKKMRGVLVFTSMVLSSFLAGTARAESVEFTNPLILKRADPQIYLHTNGTYYFTATVPEYDRIELRGASTIAGLNTATPTVIWNAHTTGAMANHIWAPELHYIGGKWYIYFAAGTSSNSWDIRVYVLENTSIDPTQKTWTEKGQLVTNGTTFALDATTFEHQGTRYLVWAEADPTLKINTALFIARTSNPWTLDGPGVRISVPDYDWEKVGYAVNEGPAVLKKNGKVFITYSASATDANYCVGLLTASDTSDLLKPTSWTKSRNPVLKSGNGVYGPGHNQFTTTPDGSVDLLVFHARDYEKITGDPLNDPNRATRVQPLRWNSDGTPNFGTPTANGTVTISLGGAGNGGNAGSTGIASGGTTNITSGGGRSSVGGSFGTNVDSTNRGGSGATGSNVVNGGSPASGGTFNAGGSRNTFGAVGSGTSRGDSGGVTSVDGRGGQTLIGAAGNVSAINSDTARGGAKNGSTLLEGNSSSLGGVLNAENDDGSTGCSCRTGLESSSRGGATAFLTIGLALTYLFRRKNAPGSFRTTC
jgi:GH43 family beta-xylosidase